MTYHHNNKDPNLNNLHHAMEYRDGVPHLRVNVGSDTITINGNINVDNVTVDNLATDPVPISSNKTQNSSNNPLYVNIGTTGTVSLSQSTLTALENINATVSGSVSISNFPATQAVTGTFWQATQPVSIATMPTTPVTGTFWQATQPVSGTVTVQDGGGTITVDGTVTANVTFPTTQQVSGTVALDANTLSALENINATVSGTVALDSASLTALETINATVSGTVELGSTTLSALENVGVTGTVTVQDGGGSITVDGSVSATVSGTVALDSASLSALEHISIDNFPTTQSVTQGTSPWVVSGSVTIDQTAGNPTLVKYINTPNNLQMDMTQRLRVATPSQTWWYAPTIDKDGDLRYIESATGANSGSIFVQNLSSINMSPGTDANGSFIRISRRRHKLRPGVGMLCTFSINWNGYVPDGTVTKRVGMFTNYNGVFFEMTGDLQAVIRRRLTDGTVVEKRIARADFNIDKLDGTGASGYDLRPVVINTSTITAYVSKTPVSITGDGTVYQVVFTVGTPGQFYVGQKGRITGVSPTLYNGTVIVTAINGSNVTFVYNVDPGVFSSVSSATFVHTNLHNQYVWGFDFNGNRATSIRFFIDGPLGRMAIHQENFGGSLGTPFANAPAISTRYEIFNTGAPGRLPNFTSSSEVVNVEAELELNPGFGVASNNTPVVYGKNGTATYPVLGIALRAGEPYQRADLQPQSVTFADIANINQQNSGVFYWRLVLNPTIGGTVPASTNVGKATRMWAYTASTTVSGGLDLLSGYAQSTQQFDVRTALNFINLGSNIAYDDSDKIVLVVKQLVGGTNDAQLVATINFIEAL